MSENKLALITAEDLALVENNALNEYQLKQILQSTPKQYIKSRPAKGGGTWDYVTGGYVKKCLNVMFGFDWSFEIVDQMIQFDEVIVKGRLTCNSNGKTIVKMQYGNKDIVYKTEPVLDDNGNPVLDGNGRQKRKPSNQPLSIGNDMKAAATDCLKKCAAEIGIAADIYNKEDFRPVKVTTSKDVSKQALEILFESYSEYLEEDEREAIDKIIKDNETRSFTKAYKALKQIESKYE